MNAKLGVVCASWRLLYKTYAVDRSVFQSFFGVVCHKSPQKYIFNSLRNAKRLGCERVSCGTGLYVRARQSAIQPACHPALLVCRFCRFQFKLSSLFSGLANALDHSQDTQAYMFARIYVHNVKCRRKVCHIFRRHILRHIGQQHQAIKKAW